MADIINIILGAVGSLLAAAIVLLIGVSSKKVRYFLFYRVRSYELTYHRTTDACICQWDIQWEDLRLTVKVNNVHNDYLENVSVLRNTAQPAISLGDVGVSYEFKKISDWPLQLRVNSIVRARCPKNGDTEHSAYSVFLHVRRRRW